MVIGPWAEATLGAKKIAAEILARINLRMNFLPIAGKPFFLIFPDWSSGSKPPFEQLYLSRTTQAQI
jgi:hypothetical protein